MAEFLLKPVKIAKHSIREFGNFLKAFLENKELILKLAKRDLQERYLGSYLGIIWAFVHPVAMLLVLWIVVEAGFKSRPVNNFPFILWLMTAMVPWFFFADSWASATNVIIQHSYLVKNVVFRVSILPVVKILSALFIHLFFIIILFILYLFYGYFPKIYNIQIIYYLFAMIILLLGLSWISSSVQVFFKDMNQIIALIIQIGFWGTPIFWSLELLPEKYHIFFKLNPVFYIIQGYRNSFIYGVWFWEDQFLTIYFWSVAVFIFISGALLFRRLRPRFADVL